MKVSDLKQALESVGYDMEIYVDGPGQVSMGNAVPAGAAEIMIIKPGDQTKMVLYISRARWTNSGPEEG